MKTSRRTFLRAAGVCLSLPVLESFGAAPASPKRMIAINQDLVVHMRASAASGAAEQADLFPMR